MYPALKVEAVFGLYLIQHAECLMKKRLKELIANNPKLKETDKEAFLLGYKTAIEDVLSLDARVLSTYEKLGDKIYYHKHIEKLIKE